MRLDWSKWAVVAHNDDTGFGRMAADIRAVLGLGRHLVIPSERLADKPLRQKDEQRLNPSCPEAELRERLAGLQGIIFFERPDWHPLLLPVARQMNIRTVCVPMWEWFRGHDLLWMFCDLFVCPSQFSAQMVRQYGWSSVAVLPWLLDLRKFPPRSIQGPARTFVHNAGLVDRDDRKGTRDTLRAFKRVKRRDIRLIVRVQKPADLPDPDERIDLWVGNLDDPAKLYAEGDVMIQPSKMEGLGFMVLEPLACGLPVLTTDYPPMNELVQQEEMRVAPRWRARRCYANAWIPHAHLRPPNIGDLARKIEWCADHDLAPISQANRAWAEQQYSPIALRQQWTKTLAQWLELG